MSTDLESMFITPTTAHLDRLLEIAEVQTPPSDWNLNRPPNWLTTLKHARTQKNWGFKIYVILVEMADNDWFGQKLMAQENAFVQEYFMERLKVQLNYHITGVREDGTKFTVENYSQMQRHVKFLVSLMRSTYLKM
jgi:hypothetical protein